MPLLPAEHSHQGQPRTQPASAFSRAKAGKEGTEEATTHLASFPQNDTQTLAHVPWEQSCSLPAGRGCGAEVLQAPGLLLLLSRPGRAFPRPNSATQWQLRAALQPSSSKTPGDAARNRLGGYSSDEEGVQSFPKSCCLYPAHGFTAQELWQQHRFKFSFPRGYFG